ALQNDEFNVPGGSVSNGSQVTDMSTEIADPISNLTARYLTFPIVDTSSTTEKNNTIGYDKKVSGTVRRIVAVVFGVSFTSLMDIDVLTRCIEAGDCDNTLNRLTKDERKAAMDTVMVLGDKFLADMSNQNPSMLN
ncbi:hypothetical protein Tco_1422722, partial [Tanacetum coccineum]